MLVSLSTRSVRVATNLLAHKPVFSTAVRYTAHGNPADVLKLENVADIDKNSVGSSEVAIKLLVSAINPSDLFQAQGKYGIQPPLPAIGGNEGVAVVEKVGSSVKSVQVGDWVVPGNPGFNTWQQTAKVSEESLVKVSKDIPAEYAATMTINPATAYRLLRDFENLKPGDWIIQNCANSMVGYAVVQMAREMGVHTINIIRSDRPEGDKVLKLLTNFGGDINIPDTFVNTAAFNEIIAELPPIKLALNGAGGPHVTNMARVLGTNGTLVTYGVMSGKPVVVPHEILAYKQLKLKGFWIAEWYKTHTLAERTAMYNDITNAIKEQQLNFFFEKHDLDDFSYALKKSQEPFYFRKVLLNMDFPDRLAEHDAREESDYDMFNWPVTGSG